MAKNWAMQMDAAQKAKSVQNIPMETFQSRISGRNLENADQLQQRMNTPRVPTRYFLTFKLKNSKWECFNKQTFFVKVNDQI